MGAIRKVEPLATGADTAPGNPAAQGRQDETVREEAPDLATSIRLL